MGMVGPEGDFGSLIPLIKFLKSLLTGRKKTDEKCVHCDGNGYQAKICSKEETLSANITPICPENSVIQCNTGYDNTPL